MVNGLLSTDVTKFRSIEELEAALESDRKHVSAEWIDEEEPSPHRAPKFHSVAPRPGEEQSFKYYPHGSENRDPEYLHIKNYDQFIYPAFLFVAQIHTHKYSTNIERAKDLIKSMVMQGKTKNFIQHIAEKYFGVEFVPGSESLMIKILVAAERMFANFAYRPKDDYLYTQAGVNTNIDAQHYISALQIFVTELFGNPQPRTLFKDITFFGKHYFTVWENDEFRMIIPKQEIGKGGVGVIHSAVKVSNGELSLVAQKLPRHFENPRHKKTAKDALRNEIITMKQAAHIAGIIKPFDIMSNIPSYTMPIYEKNCLQWLQEPSLAIQTRLFAVKHFMEYAFQSLYKYGVKHGDLSARNIMVNVGENLKIKEFAIIDNTSMHFRGESINYGWIGAPQISSKQDRDDLVACREIEGMAKEEGNKIEMERIHKKGEEILDRQDLFAWAVNFFNILSGKLPYPLSQYEEHGRFYFCAQEPLPLHLLEKSYSPRIIKIMQAMLFHNPSERLTWEVAREEWGQTSEIDCLVPKSEVPKAVSVGMKRKASEMETLSLKKE
jgi:hypothetical protein